MKIIVKKKSLRTVLFFLASSFFVNAQSEVNVDYVQRADVKDFIDEMVEQYNYDRAFLENRFSTAQRLDSVLEAIARPAEKKLTWKQYRPIFVTSKRSEKGKIFLAKHKDTLQRAEKEFGVPAEIITAIIGVETYYGKRTGSYTVFDSLTTLGFDYPPRSKFFKSELKEFLLLSKEEKISVDDMTGSYAGAMGMPQFISSSYRNYAIDFDGDGKRDLWNSVPDVIGSVANYFSEHGWKKGETILHPASISDDSIVKEKNELKPYITVGQLKQQGVVISRALDEKDEATLLKFDGKRGEEYWIGLDNFYVITRYNHSAMYSMAVFQLSEKIKD